MTSENYGDLFYSISNDGLHWANLNNGQTVFDEYRGHADITTGNDGYFYLLGNPPKGGKIRIWKSKDLIDWQLVTDHVPDMSAHPERNPHTYWVGAPKMFYDAKSKRYIITWHSTSVKDRNTDANEYWNQMRTYYILTSDFTTFTEPKRLFADEGQASIDVIIREEGGKYYAILKDERFPGFGYTQGKAIRICESDKLEGPYKKPSQRITPNFREAPTLIPRNDTNGWLLYYEQYPGIQYEVSTAPSLKGPWHDVYYHHYQVPTNARHGCMVALNQDQYDALIKTYGDETTALELDIINRQGSSVWLFVSFKDPGDRGIFMAMSTDAQNWVPLLRGEPMITPGENMPRMRDPFLVRDPQKGFHLVWTVGKKRIGYTYSEDLIHWQPQRVISIDADDERVQNTWAPELYWNTKNKEWIIHWSSTYAGEFPETDGQVKNDKNHRIYAMRTKDFKTFSKPELFYNPGYPIIDATLLDVNDSVVMVFKDEREIPELHKYLKVSTAKSIDGPWTIPSEPITESWTEGPSVIPYNNGFMLYFDNYSMPQHMEALFTLDFINYENVTQSTSFPPLYKHGSFIKLSHPEAINILDYCKQMKK